MPAHYPSFGRPALTVSCACAYESSPAPDNIASLPMVGNRRVHFHFTAGPRYKGRAFDDQRISGIWSGAFSGRTIARTRRRRRETRLRRLRSVPRTTNRYRNDQLAPKGLCRVSAVRYQERSRSFTGQQSFSLPRCKSTWPLIDSYGFCFSPREQKIRSQRVMFFRFLLYKKSGLEQ